MTDFKGQYGTFSIDANGNWTFKLDNDAKAIQQLGQGLADRKVHRHPPPTPRSGRHHHQCTNDKPTITGLATGAVKNGQLTTSGQLTQHDIDATDKHTWSVNDNGRACTALHRRRHRQSGPTR